MIDATTTARRTSLGLALFFLLGLLVPAHAQQAVEVRIDDVTAPPGETATVPIHVSNLGQAEDVLSYEFELEFDDAALSYAGFEDETTLSEQADFTLAENAERPKIGGFSSSATPLNAVADAGIMLKVKLNVETGGEHSISITNLLLNEGSPAADPATPEFVLSGSLLRINEVLPVPAQGADGDANGDGTGDASEDEFLEIKNTSTTESVDLSGYEVVVDGTVVHTISSSSSSSAAEAKEAANAAPQLDPETAYTLFGGGTPAAVIPGIVRTASGGLQLDDDGVRLQILDGIGDQVLAFRYDGDVQGESLVRPKDPDHTGQMVPHTQENAGRLFSPGRTSGGDPLPVELTQFEGHRTGQVVLLQWTTASETNNAGFRVQHRRHAGKASGWQTLGFVNSKASGSTTDAASYRYETDELPVGEHRFRLEQVDLDGTEHRSDVIAVEVVGTGMLQLSPPAPNPVRSRTVVSFSIREASPVRLTLYDLLGRRIRTVYQGSLEAGEWRHTTLSAETLPSGSYVLRLESPGHSQTQRVTVVQ